MRWCRWRGRTRHVAERLRRPATRRSSTPFRPQCRRRCRSTWNRVTASRSPGSAGTVVARRPRKSASPPRPTARSPTCSRFMPTVHARDRAAPYPGRNRRLIRVPMRRPLHACASRFTEAPLVLIDLDTDEGITGRTYIFCYLESAGHAAIALIRSLTPLLRRQTSRTRCGPADPARPFQAAQRQRPRVECARRPRHRVLGCPRDNCRPSTGALAGENRSGFPPTTATAWGCWTRTWQPKRPGNSRLKGSRPSRCASGRSRPQDDLAAVRAVRRVLNQDIAVVADFNQALSLHEARDCAGGSMRRDSPGSRSRSGTMTTLARPN